MIDPKKQYLFSLINKNIKISIAGNNNYLMFYNGFITDVLDDDSILFNDKKIGTLLLKTNTLSVLEIYTTVEDTL
jgi:hypothetical protein